MERDILSQVIEAEKEIQQCLELEKIKVREWLEHVKKESEEEFIREDKKIRESLEKSIAEATKEAEAEAAGVVSKATTEAERLEQLKPDTLSKIITKQIEKILPG
jgi:vacuolar-type H+-ATPase subunit H